MFKSLLSTTPRSVLLGLTSTTALTYSYVSLGLSPSSAPLALDAAAPSLSLDRPSPTWTPPSRAEMLGKLRSVPIGSDSESAKEGEEEEYDLIIVGGGATGAGCAVDAAARGLKVALVERDDFSSGTSSKSTKLIHGGVRYLQKAVFELDYEQYKLVREALHERRTFLHIAPYLSNALPIMLPVYQWWQLPYFYAGTKMYDLLAGSANMESSYMLGKGKALAAFPLLKPEGLCGAVVYYDGQHNDSRMNMSLIMTAVQQGATVANHVEVSALVKDAAGKIIGTKMKDNFTGEEWTVKAKGVINATGPFTDGLRQMDEPTTSNIVSPASGIHIILPNYYSPGGMGMIDPNTSDGRVIFFLPWEKHTIVGTTDAAAEVTQHPIPKEEEIEWVLNEVKNYLSPDIRVRRGDVLSAWSGLRPLVKDPDAKDTQSLVRNHMINVSKSGLLTIAGGKWTTYRSMAEETIDRAIVEYKLKPQGPCNTTQLQLLGSHGWNKMMYVSLVQHFGLETDVAQHLSNTYGDRAWEVCSMADATGLRFPVHGKRLDPAHAYIEAEVKFACRREYAATAVDIIARRTRLSFLDAEAALDVLPRVIDIMSSELGWNRSRQESEFKDATSFLESMGLSHARLENLTIDAVRRGRHKGKQEEEDELVSRTYFTASELRVLKRKFKSMDQDHDGVISEEDLSATMAKLGFGDVPKETIERILQEVDYNQDDVVQLEEFLDIAAGVKQLSLSNAFSDIAGAVDAPAIPEFVPNPSAEESDEPLAHRITVEQSGGGV